MKDKVTPENAIKAELICQLLEERKPSIREDISKMDNAQLELYYDEVEDLYMDEMEELEYDFRSSGEETNLDCEQSRHYESEQVAHETPFGWVSWTYWHGGGKHGEPEGIVWIKDAYFVDVEEKEVKVIKRTFTKQ